MEEYTRINVYLGKGAEGRARKKYLEMMSQGNVSELIQRLADGDLAEDKDVDILVADVRAALIEAFPAIERDQIDLVERECRRLWE